MELKNIRIVNFRSLADFTLEMSKFSCLIGLNGVGKSTVLHSLDFLAQLMKGDISAWLKQRQWQASDLGCKLSNEKRISFFVTIIDDNNKEIHWVAHFNPNLGYLRCTGEFLFAENTNLLRVKNKKLFLNQEADSSSFMHRKQRLLPETIDIVFKYEGSILSTLEDENLSFNLVKLKKFILGIRSLDLLAPNYLKQASRSADQQIGLGGEKLPTFLNGLQHEKKKKLLDLLKENYPQLRKLHIIKKRYGWKRLLVEEIFNNTKLTNDALYVNDGMLRMIAILSQTLTDNQFLLFDEIENGINPEIIEMLMDYLVETEAQVLVTTHSPIILNYLDDKVAIKSVQLIYKTIEGHTLSTPFFELPSMRKKLKVMGPGEVFIDTDLTKLDKEVQLLPKPPKPSQE